jgi:pimeloyl-ACP methyl ester carboxylesterase
MAIGYYRKLGIGWVFGLALLAACSGGGGGGGGNNDNDGGSDGPAPPLAASRTYRAIAGVSMGGYAALNLGTKHRDLFSTIGSLGGPVDLQQLLHDSVTDGLEVKAQTTLPRDVGEDFTFDHMPPYPDRDSRISQLQDLVISFGNPFLHNPDPARLYLASDSEPATSRRDDQFDDFTLIGDPRGFLDGGDANANGLRETSETPTEPVDVLLAAGGRRRPFPAASRVSSSATGALVDLNGDGIYDVGDGSS